MTGRRKTFLFIALPLVIVFIALALLGLKRGSGTQTTSSVPTQAGSDTATSEAIKFTHQIFDPALINFITPLGELNGGYSEWQATTGVMINIKPEVVTGGKMIDVFAPTAMTLESYSYHKDPRSDGNADWALIFRISETATIKLDHITQADEKIVAVTTSTPKDRSNEEPPKSKISFKAGERIAQTHGTKLAKNWNIYMTDSTVTNKFANQERYLKSQIGYRFINGACPFNYYQAELRAKFMVLMGATKAGQSKDCGNPSSDVAGTISGAWFFEEDSAKTGELNDGNFVSPLAIYRDSANRVVIDQIANTQFRLDGATDPKDVTAEQCYKLVTVSGQVAGFAYLKINSPTSMQLAYAASGSCPSTFPATGFKTYFR